MLWWAQIASVRWQATAVETMAVLTDRAQLFEIGFRGETIQATDPWSRQERSLAASLYRFTIGLVAQEIGDMRMWSDALPGLLGTQNERVYVDAALPKIKAIWEAWQALERQASEDEDLAGLWKSLTFTQMVWVREICVGLSENGFETPLAILVAGELLKVGRCMKTTVINENLFNHARLAERDHRATKLGRLARWHRSTVAGVLEGHDRAPPRIMPLDRAVAPSRAPKHIFTPQHTEFSLGPGTHSPIDFEHFRGGTAFQGAIHGLVVAVV